MNAQITASEVRVLDDAGRNLGIFPIAEALKMAREAELDLIEIAEHANPPVVKITSFDKFRYQKEKEEKRERRAQRTKELKHIRTSPRAAEHDISLRIRQTESFLEEGHKVEINLFLIGREKGNKEWARMKLDEFLNRIKIPYQITMVPKYVGRGFAVQITKK